MTTQKPLDLAALCEKHGILPEFREAFRIFIKSGNASEEFSLYMNKDPRVREALDVAFAHISQPLLDAYKTGGIREPSGHGDIYR